MQVEPHGGDEGQDHQAEGEPAVGEQAEQGVDRQSVAPLEKEHHQYDGGGAGEDADDEVDLEQDGERDAEQGGVRDRLAEVGEPSLRQ